MDEKAIREREQKATPGPWKACADGECQCRQTWSTQADMPVVTMRGECVGTVNAEWGDGPGMIYGEVPEEYQRANAHFIAHARTDIPALLAEVLRLKRQVNRLDSYCYEANENNYEPPYPKAKE